MFAVIQTGGKQYKVEGGQKLLVEKLAGVSGDAIEFSQILLLGGEGAPVSLEGVTVSAEIIDQVKAAKVIIFKKKRRHNYRRKRGHRQQHTLLRITRIMQGGKVLAEAPAAVAKVAKAPKAEVVAKPVKAATAAKPAVKKAAKAEGAAPKASKKAAAMFGEKATPPKKASKE